MPLHSIHVLPTGARLGLWHLRETAAELWPLLPGGPHYRPLLPITNDLTRQAQWLASRVLLHELLAAFQSSLPLPATTELWLTNAPDGQPQLAGWPGAAVSLSHSGEWVAALLAPSGRAGIDVELVRDKARRLATRFLADEELAAARQDAPDSVIFTLLWSTKETLYKLAGQRGLAFREHILTEPFSEPILAFATGALAATLHRASGQTRHLVCYTEPAPGYVLTYCHEPAEFSRTSLSP